MEGLNESEINSVMDFPYKLDTFQLEAIQAIENDNNVLVTAHTSAGKSTVAEYAIAKCVKLNKKVIYTSPIKTLSNQKYADFRKKADKLGLREDDIGIMTGDNKINPDAQCLIMTTEILRNNLYNGDENISETKMVIFDEVHYFNDKDRGHVWEESIIMLPREINLIMLSATVSGADKFAKWIEDMKGKKTPLISTPFRPVPLKHYIYHDEKIHDIMDNNGVFNHKNFDSIHSIYKKMMNGKKFYNYKSIFNPFINYLKVHNLLPGIVFSFSRKNCERYGNLISINLVSHDERHEIEKTFNHHVHKLLEKENQNLPQILSMKDKLLHGIGIHHSGLMPVLKEIVEVLFSRGLIKVLFATETFAVGVNMPARTVVFSDLNKYETGSGFRNLRTDEYMQMSGRAGRRGIDAKGTVIYLPMKEIVSRHEILSVMTGKSPKFKSQFILDYHFILKTIESATQTTSLTINNSLLNKETNNIIEMCIKEKERLEKEYHEIGNILESKKMYNTVIEYMELKRNINNKKGKQRKNAVREINMIEDDNRNNREWQDIVDKIYKRNDLEEKLYENEDYYRYLSNSANKESIVIMRLLKDMNYLDRKYDYIEGGEEGCLKMDEINSSHITLKGVVACQINECNSLLMTELIMEEGIFDNKSAIEIICILSLFIDESKVDEYDLFVDDLNIPLDTREIIKRVYSKDKYIQEICDKYKVMYSSGVNISFLEYAYGWANGKSYIELRDEENEIYEGNFIKGIMKINNISKEILKVAEVRNDQELIVRISEIEELLIRDIVNVKSLYLV